MGVSGGILAIKLVECCGSLTLSYPLTLLFFSSSNLGAKSLKKCLQILLVFAHFLIAKIV